MNRSYYRIPRTSPSSLKGGKAVVSGDTSEKEATDMSVGPAMKATALTYTITTNAFLTMKPEVFPGLDLNFLLQTHMKH